MNRIQELYKLGQSIWYDNIERRPLIDGELAALIQQGEIYGMTSNPTIFNKAIGLTHDYDDALKALALTGLTASGIFYRLAIEDIRTAADLFRSVYTESKKVDGYVSLEVSPYLAHDTAGTVSEAKRLWQEISRPNSMIKIPATKEGVDAIRQSIAAGININVTLIFSLPRYLEVMNAYLSGLEDRIAAGLPVDSIHSIASFFVSRMDTKVDPLLSQVEQEGGDRGQLASQLKGKSAIASTRLAYQDFLKVFRGKRFADLREKGANLQRPLWASTSTKNPAYRDVLYVEELIAPDTVDTVPPKTLEAFMDHGDVQVRIENHLDEARTISANLARCGIIMDVITQQLEDEGVKTFADSFTELINTVEERRKEAVAERGPLKI